MTKSRLALFLVFVLILLPISVSADHTPEPTSVTIPGSLQSELGCPGDWQPDCAATHLAFDGEDDIWQGVFSVPAGSWEYKASLFALPPSISSATIVQSRVVYGSSLENGFSAPASCATMSPENLPSILF